MSVKKRFRRDIKKIETPKIEKVLPGVAAHKEGGATRKSKTRRTIAAPLALLLSCVLIIGAAAAAVPAIIKHLNADLLTENNTRLDKVPDGYIGIYTAEELDGIRDYFSAENFTGGEYNFILMNDITFTDADYAPGGIAEGGWEPIQSRWPSEETNKAYISSYGFFGTFNGNGYVIRNLKIRAEQESEYVGLFGYTNANFINLGIEICEITIRNAVYDRSLHVGAIAGKADFIGGCYASGLSIDVNINTADLAGDNENNKHSPKVYVGGLGGSAKHLDSCYSDAKITVTESGYTAADLRVGGLAGASTSCVTSYSIAQISAEAASFFSCQIDPITISDAGSRLPVLIGKETMEKIYEVCGDYYGEESFAYRKIKAYFLLKDLDLLFPSESAKEETEKDLLRTIKNYYFTEDVSDIRGWYVFDPLASVDENNAVAASIAEAFGGYDNFQRFCLENRIKCGILYCYSFEDGTKLAETDLETFNFEKIWLIKDGRATLSIFES